MLIRRGEPTPPIAFGAGPVGERLGGERVAVDGPLRARLAATGADVIDAPEALAESSRDWWPLAMIWALDARVAARAAVVVRPHDTDEICAVLRACNDARVPVTAAAGRSGVCGASVPVFGGVVLDLTALSGIIAVDTESLLVDVAPGTFGDVFEDELRERYGLTCGHWPQSIAISTVGGWLACRGAGQFSTRYGKIEDIVEGLDVVLADGTLVHTGGHPRAAAGPDLTQLFVGSEGTLGIIVGARLRAHRLPSASTRSAWSFPDFDTALGAMRSIVQRGATPAVLRAYDPIEAARSYEIDAAVLLVHDEADPHIVDATRAIVEAEVGRAGATRLDDALVERWFSHRNDASALEALISRGFVVDTMEVSAPWRAVPGVYAAVTTALRAVEHTVAASAHQSHSYTDGACLYFTFAGRPPADERETYYRAVWDAGQRAALGAGASLAHHHGVGLNRSRFAAEALGSGLGVLAAVKTALDPHGILNPGKLGLASPFGDPVWP